MITFDAVTKAFPGGTVAVDNLSIELPTGQITVFVGPSGCGKTTSLRMINRLIEPTSGTISIDGEDVTKQDAAVLRRKIGYVIQHAGLFPHRTVQDNIATVPLLNGVNKKQARENAVELLGRVGLDASMATRYPAQLSGGQQQRVGVARALAADPPVMLMDEPFSAVDPIVRDGLQKEFLRLQAEVGKTIAFVTHDIDEAIKLGDTVAVFREGGHLAQVGTPQELLDDPADDFVADFVGRDRGFRGLSFVTAEGLEVEPVQTYVDGVRGVRLLLDDAGRPRGWTVNGSDDVRAITGTFTKQDSLRLVTDLAISSPAGVAVRVDGDGVADGAATHASIADHLADARRESAG
ncbi:MAG: ATP-binding cassette domain-containing protein [Nocardioidaceae bacterium]|nr:ATP-binding cassette domain-containing protein [Nocardioidaceae bacterium]NUS51406.1 ATP-binding cassette domain-containing protein [Nocardioidaceae bacterium]